MKIYNNKFNFTENENIYYAKRYIKQSVYNSIKFEGYKTTFPQTETILNGVSVGGLPMQEVEGILNLRDGWNYILTTLNKPLSVEYLTELHRFTGRNEALEWGKLRSGKVGISGTNYIPPLPNSDYINDNIKKIMKLPIKTSSAIYVYLFLVKNQIFWDVNKRTSMLVMNKILIENGCGWCTIDLKDFEEFNVLLTNYFNNDGFAGIDDFLYNKCIKGNIL